MKQAIAMLNHPVRAYIEIPGSKSITNRALLLAALASGVSVISNILISDDTFAFKAALIELGVKLQLDEEARTCTIEGCAGIFPKSEAKIWCDSAGTVARFLLAAAASSPGLYSFDATPQLRNRPIAGLINAVCAQGARVKPKNTTHMPFTILGTDGFDGGEIEIDGSETGQYVSALLMVAPFAKSAVTINAHHLVSRSYVSLTSEMMADFGVLVRHLHSSRFAIPVPQRYEARHYVVEPDLSTASYFFAIAALNGGEMSIQALDRAQSKQGDVVFLSILEKMGCQVTESQDKLTVTGPAELKGVSVDMRDFSDTFMTLAVIAPFAKTPTTITNIGHTRLQESDRIRVMRTELEKLGVKVEEGDDWLKIYPSAPLGGVIDAHQDHRIAMSFAILGLRVPGIEIEGAECVSKTCPQFFEMLAKVCG